MSLPEFDAVMKGAALRNGAKPDADDAPSDDEFYAALWASKREGSA